MCHCIAPTSRGSSSVTVVGLRSSTHRKIFYGAVIPLLVHFTERKYCFVEGMSSIWKSSNFFFASSVLTDGATITLSPYFQLTGVAKPSPMVICIEVMTRKISSKFLPVVAGYKIVSFTVVL